MRFLSVTVLVPGILVLAMFPISAAGQIPPSSSTTSTPTPGAGHDYLGGISETVNPVNGSVSLRIPVIIPPGRGITLPLSIAYDSNGMDYLTMNGAAGYIKMSNSVFSTGGWSFSVPQLSTSLITWQTMSGQQRPTGPLANGTKINCYALVNYVFQDANGGRHNLDLTNYSDPGGTGPCSYNTGDWPPGFQGEIVTQGGEGPILATIPTTWGSHPTGTITDGDGTAFSFAGTCCTVVPSSAVDRNGNTISINLGSGRSFNYVDTAGRTVVQDTGFATSPESLTVSGLSNPYTLTWTPLSVPSYSTPYTVLSGSCGIGFGGWGSQDPNAPPSPALLSTLTLPTGQSYTFSYDPNYRVITRITYPTGGYVRYVWAMNLQAEAGYSQNVNAPCAMHYAVPAVTDRYVSFDGSTEVLHQTFAYSTTWGTGGQNIVWTSKQTTVTTTDLVRSTSFQTVYSYIGLGADDPPNTNGAPTSEDPVESSVAYYDVNGALLKTVSKKWANVRLLSSQQTSYPNGTSALKVWCYNTNELTTETDDYDFGSSTVSPPSCVQGVGGGQLTAGSLLRKTSTSYQSFGTNHIVDKPSSVIVYNGSGAKAAETDYGFDNPAGTVLSGIVQHGSGCNCGNLTSEARWVNSSGSTLTTHFTNDNTGQRLTMTDPAGNQTFYSYSDNFSSGSPPGPTNTYVTQITYPATANASHIEKFAYAYASAEVTSSIDQNNLTTTYHYNDSLSRLTETDFPDGGQTLVAYNDSPYNPSTPSPSVTTTKKVNTSTSVVSVSTMDGLGHALRKELTSDPQGTDYTDTVYDGNGRAYTVSNPYRSGNDPTTSAGTTTAVYDGLGRKISETAPDGAVTTTAYCGANTLVTDATGRWRRSRVDGLGRLVEVDEPNAVGATVNSNGCPGQSDPVWVTSYTVDTLGNLTQVVQNGSRQRNFTYDMIPRLLTANNPETGTITYTWDTDSACASLLPPNPPPLTAGALASKLDARGFRTCYQLDALRRETMRVYSNSDPSVTTAFDQSNCLGLSSCVNIGHRTSGTDGAGSEAWSYQVDSVNHRSVHVQQRTTTSSGNNITKTSTYYLDLSGNVTSVIYPTGRVVNYTFDAADRPSTATDGSSGITYATDFQTPPTGCLASAACYTPQGTFYAMSIGQSSSFTGLNLSHTYNNRLQPQEFKAVSSGGSAMDITYNFVDPVSGKNAGHVFSIANNLNSNRSQSFGYDQLNRITSAGTLATAGQYCWGYLYSYDGGNGAWGNLTAQTLWTAQYPSCQGTPMGPVTADGNNHLSAFSYDAAGNAQNDSVYSYTWDAESQMKSANGVNYSYDGDGRRVYKSSGKLYWYGSGDEILAETDGSGNVTTEYVFFGGKRVAMLPAGGNPQYYVEDFLGSSRTVTTSTGVTCYDADFTPFGSELTYTNNCPTQNNYKFEGKERDTETQNDDFGARYYTWRFGRWLSADWSATPVAVPYANLLNPQTLNLYSMVADDPETFADLDGHDIAAWINTICPLGFCGFNGSGNGRKNTNPTAQQADNQATAEKKKTEAQNQSSTAQQQNGQQRRQSQQFTVTVNNRPANIPGGKVLDALGADHQWITTSEGASAGMGTAKGVPQSDYPGVQTEVVDHHGQVPTSTTTYTNVDRAAINSYLVTGTHTGRWVPGANDCNTWVQNAISQSTPHDIYAHPPVITRAGVSFGPVAHHNVVVYANGSIHSPGGP